MVVALGLGLPRAVAFTRDNRDYPIIIVIGAEDIHHRLGLTGKYRQSGVDLFEEPGGGFFGGGLDDEAGAEVAGEYIRLSYTLAYDCRINWVTSSSSGMMPRVTAWKWA